MLGILLILTISWLLLYLLEKESILALGFLPAGRRALQFVLGFLFSAVLCVMVQFTEAGLESSKWELNEDFSYAMLISSLWWDVRSVLTEELIFRGLCCSF